MQIILETIVGLACLLSIIINLIVLGVVVLIWHNTKSNFKELKKMANAQEEALNAGLDTLQEGVGRIITELQTLQANNPDLTDELQRVTGLATAINTALGQVAGGETPTPIEVPPTGGGDTGGGSVPDTGSGETPANGDPNAGDAGADVDPER